MSLFSNRSFTMFGKSITIGDQRPAGKSESVMSRMTGGRFGAKEEDKTNPEDFTTAEKIMIAEDLIAAIKTQNDENVLRHCQSVLDMIAKKSALLLSSCLLAQNRQGSVMIKMHDTRCINGLEKASLREISGFIIDDNNEVSTQEMTFIVVNDLSNMTKSELFTTCSNLRDSEFIVVTTKHNKIVSRWLENESETSKLQTATLSYGEDLVKIISSETSKSEEFVQS